MKSKLTWKAYEQSPLCSRVTRQSIAMKVKFLQLVELAQLKWNHS